MSDSNSNSGGLGLLGATFIVFLVLKLTHVINWSWWWVTAPLWIPAAVALGIAILIGLIAGAVKGIKDANEKKAAKALQEKRKALRDRGRS